jgi:hypothetical protein
MLVVDLSLAISFYTRVVDDRGIYDRGVDGHCYGGGVLCTCSRKANIGSTVYSQNIVFSVQLNLVQLNLVQLNAVKREAVNSSPPATIRWA